MTQYNIFYLQNHLQNNVKQIHSIGYANLKTDILE